jgi:hypothetical protein
MLRKLPDTPQITGGEPLPEVQIAFPPYPSPLTNATDIIGDTVTVGSTWYDYQHNGQIGRMIAKDAQGYIHIVWTRGEDQTSSLRHVYYNTIEPSGYVTYGTLGTPVESSMNGGYTNIALDSTGRPYVAFHQLTSSSSLKHSAVAVDLLPPFGAFLTYEVPWQNGQDREIIWPRIAMKHDGQFFVISRENGTDTQNWALGTFDPGTLQVAYTDPVLAEPASSICNCTGASRVSNKLSVAYTATAFPSLGWTDHGSDIHYMIDPDGINLNLDDWLNLTSFLPPDTSFYPDTMLAEGDTLRAYADCDVFVDQNNFTHLTFTTIMYFTIEGGLTYWNCSQIYTWSEQYPEEFHVVARAWDPTNYVHCGGWNFQVQRPSLGQEPNTGYLYCMYQKFDVDTTHLSQFNGQSGWGMPSGEICISVSTDGGRTWSVGTNVTNTITPNLAPPGLCQSETFPSMAEQVDDYCHITYNYDYDAGSFLQTEGTITLNRIVYHRVPTGAIATIPLMHDSPLHVEHLTGVAHDPKPEHLPIRITLQQNVPNPFNPSTTISYQLPAVSHVSLKVYDTSGRFVMTLADGLQSAGNHEVIFEGPKLASGIYLAILEAGNFTAVQKMVLLK